MTSKFLLLNLDEGEVIVFGAKFLRDRFDHIITQDGISLASTSFSVRNLGVIFDQDLSFKSHITLAAHHILWLFLSSRSWKIGEGKNPGD